MFLLAKTNTQNSLYRNCVVRRKIPPIDWYSLFALTISTQLFLASYLPSGPLKLAQPKHNNQIQEATQVTIFALDFNENVKTTKNTLFTPRLRTDEHEPRRDAPKERRNFELILGGDCREREIGAFVLFFLDDFSAFFLMFRRESLSAGSTLALVSHSRRSALFNKAERKGASKNCDVKINVTRKCVILLEMNNPTQVCRSELNCV